uniref:ShKT domain-containing protein n=1 Tax=Biomphalaria glabrata TaxID=6526 RepID=A0A2C9KD19_BIOGL
MVGCHSGMTARVILKVVEYNGTEPLRLHCIIHQQNLCGKVLNLKHVIMIVLNTVNFIKSQAMNHRTFKDFLAEIESGYEEVLFHKKCEPNEQCNEPGYLDKSCQCICPKGVDCTKVEQGVGGEKGSEKCEPNEQCNEPGYLDKSCQCICPKGVDCTQVEQGVGGGKGTEKCEPNEQCNEPGYLDKSCQCICPKGVDCTQVEQAVGGGKGTGSECKNKYSDKECKLWAANGDCKRNKQWMEKNCNKSCGCGGIGEPEKCEPNEQCNEPGYLDKSCQCICPKGVDCTKVEQAVGGGKGTGLGAYKVCLEFVSMSVFLEWITKTRSKIVSQILPRLSIRLSTNTTQLDKKPTQELDNSAIK